MMRKVRQYIKELNMIEEGDRIVVGVSGGADSVALLLILKEIQNESGLQLFVVHINHGIRKEAAEDAAYVKQLCASLAIPFSLFEADIPAMAKERGATEEEMGRLYRYQCFCEVMENMDANKLAVAHHRDDQAETMLFHIIRGSGIGGMEGMHPITDLWMSEVPDGSTGLFHEDRKWIIRPLLCCRKRELVDWLQQQGVSWKEDSTNIDDAYSRNCIRNQVVPVLEQINAKAVEHVARLAEEMTAYHEFFQKIVDTYIKDKVTFVNEAVGKDSSERPKRQGDTVCECDRAHLLQQDKLLIRAIIYEMLVLVCGRKKDLASVHVQAVYELLENQSGKKISLPYKMEAETSYEKLIIRKRLEETEEPVVWEEVVFSYEEWLESSKERCILLPDGARLRANLLQRKECTEEEWKELVKEAGNPKNNYTKFFECDTIKDMLCVRFTRSDDCFVMNDKGARKKVSRYLIDEKIPREQRKYIPVLAENERVLWIIGRRRCEECKVTMQSTVVLKLIYEGE